MESQKILIILLVNFKWMQTWEKKNLEVGDTTTLTVTVSGKGNIRGILLPEPDLKNLFKVYPDQPETHQTETGNQIAGKKIFKFALVPLKPGLTNLPIFSLFLF
ncbi:MAG: hypothetical protein CM1200mP16_03210 [Nitrospina sp.]|nr:MAG: hypothetical protein CM1200mP16_03210 [Nitrospina sp.]